VLLAAGALSGCAATYDGGDGGLIDGAADSSSQAGVEPGTLTAGAWDDNRNYEWFTSYLASQAELADAPLLDEATRDASHEAFSGSRSGVASIDVALVVDNTGSMADEIDYLKVEFTAIANRIHTEYPGIPVRWATVAYRDQGDAFVVRSADFSSDASMTAVQLASMSADGGGDYPEAVAQALAETVKLSWQSEGRIVFWVGDAPHHPGEAATVTASLLAAKEHGLHVYPVASSGTDALTELTMRSAAQLTGGRYLFLTDDSGVGDTHLEPSIPCYFVTKLDDAVVRMVGIEISGTYVEPDADEILRTGGDPEDGACQLEDGSTVVAF
jgi:hypothetical protein